MLLELEQVSSFYGRTQILRDIDFGVPKGSCVCVLGRNGVGKTSLLECLAGLRRHHALLLKDRALRETLENLAR